MGGRADLQESSSATRGCTVQVIEYGLTQGSAPHSPTRCAWARHTLNTPAKAEEPAGAQRRSQIRGWAPTGQDTVETLKQAYFQGYPESAGCVQGSIDSRNSAIHSAYRISLRPSSLFEPRHPSLKVVRGFTELRTLAESPSRVRDFTVPRGRCGSVNAGSRGISVQGATTIAST